MDIETIIPRLFFVLMLSFVLNIPLGMWRTKTKKFSLTWFLSIHLAVPLIYLLRVKNGFASWTIVIFVTTALLGQLAGGSILKNLAKRKEAIYKQS